MSRRGGDGESRRARSSLFFLLQPHSLVNIVTFFSSSLPLVLILRAKAFKTILTLGISQIFRINKVNFVFDCFSVNGKNCPLSVSAGGPFPICSPYSGGKINVFIKIELYIPGG